MSVSFSSHQNKCEAPSQSQTHTSPIFYRIICSLATDEDGISHTTYGIVAEGQDGATLDRIDDITRHKSSLETLVLKMNQNHLSLRHFRDVIEDFLV